MDQTPLPSRRVTRSQASIMGIKINNKGLENEECNNGVMKSRQRKNVGKVQDKEGSALIDITNGSSPIVGLAMGRLKTPSSKRSNKRMIGSKSNMTPGSGESLLRGQVKSLLQKVEEEGVVLKTCFEHNVWYHNHANTPNFSTSQMVSEVMAAPNEGENDEKNVITRSLFSDFLENSHDSDSNASLWSVEVNASTSDECKECEDVVVDELCEGLSKISVNEAVKFSGKHIRFVYNSDGELEGEVSLS